MNLKLNIKKVQTALEKPILRDVQALGIDTATRTGWCIITTDKKSLYLTYDFLDLTDKEIEKRLDQLISYFKDIIKPNHRVVIEDSFLRFNPRVFGLLSKFEGALYALSKIINVSKVNFIQASSARMRIGANSSHKKEEIHQWLRDKLHIDIEDKDIVDAIILALNGVLYDYK